MRTPLILSGLLSMQLVLGSYAAAGDVKISIPRREVSTPSQKLNREGVAELKRGHQEKAKKLFYKAYLIDPQDPFTLNNLGYVAELEGDADRALRYYTLAGQDHTDAIIDQSTENALKGKPLDQAFQHVEDANQQISKVNEQAIVQLQKGYVFEARNLLKAELALYPNDPFLLNNLGFALESLGDLEGALRSYSAAASLHSNQKVIVTPRQKWRGHPISQIAAENAAALTQKIAQGEGVEATTARLNLRGVAALNDNNPSGAREFFMQAYHQDSQNSFTLNNLGYIAEMAGDRESAEMYYEAARSGRDAKEKVAYSTRRDAEGLKIDSLANDNQSDVDSRLRADQTAKRHANHPIELKRRPSISGNTQEATPVPAIGVQSPNLPPLQPPDSQQDRPATPDHAPDSTPPQTPEP